MGKSTATKLEETATKRQIILNSGAYKSGERFDANEIARLLKGTKAQAYHLLMNMVEDGDPNLSCHKGKRGYFTRRNTNYLRMPWRKHTNFQILNRKC